MKPMESDFLKERKRKKMAKRKLIKLVEILIFKYKLADRYTSKKMQKTDFKVPLSAMEYKNSTLAFNKKVTMYANV